MYKRVLHLAVPMILSNLTIPLLGLVDTAVMGHLPHAYYLAAVGIGAMLFDLLYGVFGFLRMGTTGLTSQAFGKQNYSEAALVLARHTAVAALIGCVLILFQIPLAWLAFHMVDATPTVAHYAKLYYHYRIWGAPAALINVVLVGWFIGMHKPKWPLVIMMVINVFAALLDVWFVYGLGMTSDGVAMASVLAQYLGCFVGGYAVLSALRPHRWHWQKGALFARESMRELVGVNRDIFIRTLSLLAVFLFFTRQGAQYGAIVLAANVVLMNFQSAMAFALDGFANAAEALVGAAVGNGDRQQLRSAIAVTGWFCVAIAVVIAGIYFVLGPHFINALTAIKHVRHTALQYLPYLIASPLISVWSYWLDGIFVGATWVAVMRNTMLIAVMTFFAVLWLLLAWGNVGLWIAFLSFMAMRAIGMAWWLFVRNRQRLALTKY